MSDSDKEHTALAIATAFANDDNADVVAAVQAAQQFDDLLAHTREAAENNPRPGFYLEKAHNKNRGFLFGKTAHLRNYFGLNIQPPVYD